MSDMRRTSGSATTATGKKNGNVVQLAGIVKHEKPPDALIEWLNDSRRAPKAASGTKWRRELPRARIILCNQMLRLKRGAFL
jgi:hypothetical protein